MQAIILSVGDELVLGQTIDTNSAFLADQLVRLGVFTLYHQTVADDRAAIARALVLAAQSAGLVLVTGGLGPTEDDLTRDALADALGVELVVHEPSVEAMRALFARRGREMPERNRLQAMHPRGSDVIPNTCGTAPGIRAALHGAAAFVMPGVPEEMQAMWRCDVQPAVQRLLGGGGAAPAENGAAPPPRSGVILTLKINTFGLGESSVAERLGPALMDRARNPKVGTTVAGGVVSVRLRSEFPDAALAQAQLDQTAAEVERRLGAFVYGRDEATLQAALVALLRQRSATLATAESCTGGLVGKMLTDVPGASAAYLGGWIAYANAMKRRELGVPADALAREGAVSRLVALALARGAKARAGADWGLSVTGVAGPEGGTADKPVGAVWVALAWNAGAPPGDAAGGEDAMLLSLGADRDVIRDRAARFALQMLRFHLLGVDAGQMTWGKRA